MDDTGRPVGNLTEILMHTLDDATDLYVNHAFDSFWAIMERPFTTLVTMFFILFGYALWRGLIALPVQTMLTGVIRISIIYVVISQQGVWSQILQDFVFKTPDAVAATISGEANAGIMEQVGGVYGDGLRLASLSISAGSFIWGVVLAFVIFVGCTLMFVYALYLLALSKIATAILLGLAPVFFTLLMFKKTEKMFEAWLRQVINYMLISVLTLAVLFFSIRMASETASYPIDKVATGSIVVPLCIYMLTYLFLTRVMSIAEALSGGVTLSGGAAGMAAARDGLKAGATMLGIRQYGIRNTPAKRNTM